MQYCSWSDMSGSSHGSIAGKMSGRLRSNIWSNILRSGAGASCSMKMTASLSISSTVSGAHAVHNAKIIKSAVLFTLLLRNMFLDVCLCGNREMFKRNI